MSCYVWLLVMITVIDTSTGLIVVGPKFVRSNQEYTVVISNYFEHLNKISLTLVIEGYSDDGNSIFSIVKNASLWTNTNSVVRFYIPSNNLIHDVKLAIKGQEGFSYNSEEHLVYLSKSIAGLIQINKPVFKPCDTVKFRVIVLDTEMKPPAGLESVNVKIQDPQTNVIQHWSSAKLYTGVFEGDLKIGSSPLYGKWNIMVYLEEEDLVSKSFEVMEYELPSFDLQVIPTAIPLEEHETLNLTIAAKYYFGMPLQGMAKVELYLEDGELVEERELYVNGTGQVSLQLHEQSNEGEDQQDVQVKVTFVEQLRNQSVSKNQTVSIYKYPYQSTLSRECEEFHPESPFNCSIVIWHHDGSPASNVVLWVDVIGKNFENNQTYTTDHDGKVKVIVHPEESTEEILLVVTQNGTVLLWDKIYKKDKTSTAILKLELMSFVKLNQPIRLMANCNVAMRFLVYYVISKRKIVNEAFTRTYGMKKVMLEINASENMLPKATILVSTVFNKTMIKDSLEIDFRQMRNQLSITLNNAKVKPGKTMELRLKGRPGAFIGLAAYDRSLLAFSKQHDLFWKDVLQVYESFHSTDASEYDAFYSKGIFVKLSGGVQTGDTLQITDRIDNSVTESASNHEYLRTNFLDSLLWKNVTLGSSGRLKLVEVVPDRTASWCVTGFSIDPKYGFGIIKKPIQFTAIKPLYIVDYLPKFIKRGEEVEFRFTLFNNLEVEHTFNVTLYNVENQMEFVGQSSEVQSYTQSVLVGPKIGAAVSFLVKVRKLGEVDILVRAYTLFESETDSLEKVIRVVPESLFFSEMESRWFGFDTYTNQPFWISLDINKKADKGSIKIQFNINSNILITVKNDLNELLELLSENRVNNDIQNLSVIIIVRDYLNAIGSTDLKLIEKATNLMRKGYKNLMHFRRRDGSFGVLHNASSLFLTAFTANALQTASKYINEIDNVLIQKAFDWLATQQHSSGRFDEVGSGIRTEIQGGLRNGVALTSYVLVAFLENAYAKVEHAVVIEKGMRYLTSQVRYINNTYDLSIATYAMMTMNGHDRPHDLLRKLIEKSSVINNRTEIYWDTENSIETTAYALLSFVKEEKYLDGERIMRWLVKQLYDAECIVDKHKCFVILKALTKLAEKISPSRNNYTVQLKYKWQTKTFLINSPDTNVTKFEDITEFTSTLKGNVAGVGFGLLFVDYRYSLDLRNFDNRFNLTLEKQNTGSELMLRVCASFIPILSDNRSNMSIEVNFPSGYVVGHNPISKQTAVNPIQKIEIRYGGTSVVVFYNDVGVKKNCFTVTAYRRLRVALRRPAYVIAYDADDPRLNGIEIYEVDNLKPCEISDENECSANEEMCPE